MARSKVLQVPLNERLEREFEKFKGTKDFVSDAECGRHLIEFALRILNDDSADEVLTNRELMEEIFRYVRRSGAITNLIHAQTLNEVAHATNRARAVELQKEMGTVIDVKVDEFLSAEHKKG